MTLQLNCMISCPVTWCVNNLIQLLIGHTRLLIKLSGYLTEEVASWLYRQTNPPPVMPLCFTGVTLSKMLLRLHVLLISIKCLCCYYYHNPLKMKCFCSISWITPPLLLLSLLLVLVFVFTSYLSLLWCFNCGLNPRITCQSNSVDCTVTC